MFYYIRFGFILIIILLSASHVNAAQFEDYQWGMSKKEAIKHVKQDGYKIDINQNYGDKFGESIGYKDRLLGYKIGVTLEFTPKTKKLWAVSLKSSKKVLGEKLRLILTDKYGKPDKSQKIIETYGWTKNGMLSIYLKYKEHTVLNYYSTKYSPIFFQEKKELDQKEDRAKF